MNKISQTDISECRQGGAGTAGATVALTALQQELWLAHLGLPEGHPGISCGGLFDLVGCPPDEGLLRAALGVLVRHFPLLSATLRQGDDLFPRLVTGRWPRPEFTAVDLSGEPDPARAAQDWLRAFAEHPFDPVGGPLCRFALLRVGGERTLFVNRFFHLAADGIVCITHFNVLASIYNDLLAGRPPALGAPPDWRDDVREDRDHCHSSRLASDTAFWRQQLASLPTEAQIPPLLGRPGRIETIARLEYDLPRDTVELLRQCASAHKAGVADTLLALHLLVLARLHDRQQLTIQVPVRFGERRDQWGFHGHRVNVVPLRLEIRPEETVAELLAAVQRQMRALLRRARTPFQLAVRGHGEHPGIERIWDTNFNFIAMPAAGRLGEARPRLVTPVTSRLDQVVLGIYAVQAMDDSSLHLSIDYSRNHWREQDVRHYLERLRLVLGQVTATPRVLLTACGVLLPHEQAAMRAWQAGEARPGKRGSIPELFAEVAARHGDRPAVTAEGGVSRSYHQVAQRADGIAAWLRDSGTTPGQVVAVLARRHPALAETILGVMRAGAVYLPVDPDYPAERIRHMLADSGATRVLALEEDDVEGVAGPGAAELPPAEPPGKWSPLAIDPRAAAYLIYTSGSTGQPKGVVVPHQGFVNMIQAQIRHCAITPADHCLHFASPSFDASLSEIFMALLAGATLHPVSRALIDEPWSLQAFMTERQISVVTFPPSYLRLFNRAPLPGLRVLLTAGEPPLADDARHYAARLTYINAYGPTECSVCATMVRLTPESVARTGLIGRPIANTSAYILDRAGQPVAPGIPGELCLAGPGVALGYLRRPELTAARFVQAVFDPGVRLYRTGDQAAWSDHGEIILLGRLDEQVKVRGHRVEPGEISAALTGHPLVAQAAVAPLPRPGQGPELVAFLVGSGTERPSAAELRPWLRQQLPDYMIPARCHWLAALPIAPSGKVDRARLLDLAAQALLPGAEAAATGSELEEEVRRLFAQVLGRPVSSLETDFFALGGDSLRLMELAQRLARAFGSPLSNRQLFADSSVAAVAALVRETRQADTRVAVAVAEDGTLPLSEGQRQLWVLDRMRGPSAQYNMPFAVQLEAEALDELALEQALLQAVDAQPLCRVVVTGDIDQPHLRLLPTSGLRVQRQDLRAVADPELAAATLFHACCQQPFSLTEPPLVRALLLRMDERRWRLLLVMHHLVGDGASLRLLLSALCAALHGKQAAPLPAALVRGFVLGEQAYLQSPEAEADLAWWRRRLAPPLPRLDLVARPRPRLQGGEGDLRRLSLPAATVTALQALIARAGCSRLACFLTLVLDFLAEESGSADIAVGVPVGLRDGPELQEVVGYFVNTVVVRAPGDHQASDLLGRVRAVAQDLSRAVAHGRYPFALLAEAVAGQRDPSRSPLVDILVTEIDEKAMLAELEPPPGLVLSPVAVALQASKLDFSFLLHPRAAGGIDLLLEYDSALATPEEAASLLARCQASITRAVSGDDAAMSESPRQGVDAVSRELAALWRQVLGVAVVTAESDFFACGGDSIKAIRMVGQLRRQGISGIVPADLFAQPGFAQLCALARRGQSVASGVTVALACRPGEAIPLLPVQERLFRHHAEHWRRFHLVLPLGLDEGVDGRRLRQAVQGLPARHEALRLAFDADGHGVLLTHGDSVVWDEFVAPAGMAVDQVAREAAGRLFNRLDPATGRLCGGVLACHGSGRLLLLGGHHLVLDAVSLDILRQELAWYCRHGAWPPPQEGCGPLAWAAHLASQHQHPLWQRELERWRAICATPDVSLPGSLPTAVDRAGERVLRSQRVALARPLTAQPRVEILAALGQALYAHGVTTPLVVLVEGHGREAAFAGLDVTQAVGWFTTTAPLLLTPAAGAGEVAAGVAAWFAELAANGLGHGILARAHGEALAYQPQLSFNYLGRLAGTEDGDGFTPLPHLALPGALPGLLHPDFRCAAPLDLMVYATGDHELVLVAYFSPRCLDEAWLEALLHAWGQLLHQPPSLPEAWQQLALAALCQPEEIESVWPLTSNQEAMLFQQQLDGPHSLTYRQQINFRLRGPLDLPALHQAWQLLIARHGALRGLFPRAEDGEARWLVLRQGRVLVEQHDLRQMPAAMAEQLLAERLRQRRQHPFALDQGPLLAMQLFLITPETWVMSWCFHHILMDGWCIGILLPELFAAYGAIRQGATPELAPPPPWQPYLRWRRQCDEQAAMGYWQGYLAAVGQPTPLAAPAAAERGQAVRQELEGRLDAAATVALQQHASRAGVTLPILLQALWALLLSRECGGCGQVLFGLISAGRPAEVEGMAQLVGLFIQTLPVRIRLNDEEPFAALLRRVQDQALARAPFEFLPLADIQRCAPFAGPLFDHILVFENYPTDGVDLAGAPVITEVTGFEQHPYACGLSVVPGEELLCRFSWNPARMASDRVASLMARWQALLACCSRAGEESLPLLTGTLRTRVLPAAAVRGEGRAVPASFHETSRPYPRQRSIDDLFREVAGRAPEAVALVSAAGEVWDYRRLDRCSDRVAAGLSAVAAGEVVACALERGPEAMAVLLGILKAGGGYLPLDAKSPPQRLRRMLAMANCRRVIHDGPGQGLLPPEFDGTAIAVADLLRAPGHPQERAATGAEALAYVMFTSGSSGEPKGVMIPHRAVLRLARNNGFLDILAGDRVLQAGPLGFDASTLEIWGALLNGAGLCFIADDQLLTPGGLGRRIRQQRITILWLTASLCNLLIDEDPSLFAPLRVLLTGGEPLSARHMGRLLAACPGLVVINGYGPTENTTFTTTHRILAADVESGTIPIGRPIANTRVYVLGDDHTPALIGQWGELCAAGDGLALGYLAGQDAGHAAFVELAPPIGERVYRTGDIVRWREDGVLEFQGRRDAQVKVRGYRIELAEIEAALLALPLVRQAAVVASGTGEERQLVAFVLLEEGDGGTVAAALADGLPGYMIPGRIEPLARFPLTKNGKLDRAALEELARDPGPETAVPAPPDSLPARVAALFSEVLRRPVTSLDDDFYRLGGQSLKAMRLLARINRGCQVELSLRDVLTHTTVAALARRIEQVRSRGGARGAAIPSLGELPDYPLASGQERIWFMQQLVSDHGGSVKNCRPPQGCKRLQGAPDARQRPASYTPVCEQAANKADGVPCDRLQQLSPRASVYTLPFAVRLAGRVDARLLEQALALVEARHDALRLRVPASIGPQGLRQRLARPGEFRLAEVDCTRAADPARALAEAVAAEAARPFALGYEHPLWRAMLARESAEGAVLLLTCHHLICDGWSAGIFFRDLATAWQALSAGATPQWPDVALRYVDYAAWQRASLASPQGEALGRRWLARLTPLPEPLVLPSDYPRPAVRSFAGGVHRFHLDEECRQGIERLAQGAATSRFVVLAALVQLFLYRHSGQEDMVIGVPVAGRQHQELEGVVGFFVNTLPLSLHLDPRCGFATLLGEVAARWQQALSDQLYPLEALVEALALPRELSRNPLFDVLVAEEEGSWTEVRGADGLLLTPYPLTRHASKLDLSFYFREAREGLEVDIEYSTDLFAEPSVARMAERFVVLARAVCMAPEAPMHTLSVMAERERQLVVTGFNRTDRDWPLEQTIDDLFRRQLGRTAAAVAIRAAGGSELSYAALDQRVEELARGLAGHGVGPGSHVGVSFERSPELMMVIFAILRLGAVYVPFVPGLPRERVAAMAEDLGEVVMCASVAGAAGLRQAGFTVLTLDQLRAGAAGVAGIIDAPLPGDPAYVLFTSGSTGRPKGVVIEHRSVVNRIVWMQEQFPLGPGDVILQKTPVSFDVSVWELFWWSWTGATLAQLPPGGEKDPAEIVAMVAASRATVMHFVPSMLRAFLHHLERQPGAVDRIASLRYVFASGEALTPDLVHRFNRLIHQRTGAELHNLYGPTEATVDVTWHPCSPFDEQRSSVPIGRPIANTRLYVLDPWGHPAPLGVAGELMISGVQVARGYVNRPELTAERFVDDPFWPGMRMYRTGDLARWLLDGAIDYLGRSDHQVKVRGFRIELGEVEAALERIASVAQAVVRVTELAGLPALEAFLLPQGGAALERAAIRRQLMAFLPEYMIPSLFYRLEHIPVNASGKADRQALRGVLLGQEASPAPLAAAEDASPAMLAITALWRQVLPAGAGFGARENFFEVGGNSMLLIRLHELLEGRWPGLFSLPDLFVTVTVAQQAERLHGAEAPEAPRVAAPQQPEGETPAVAVIGMAVRLADYDLPQGLWSDLLAGVDRTRPMPEQRRVETCAMLAAIGIPAEAGRIRPAAYLEDISGFDCQRFGLAPIDITLLDPEQRLFLETACRCLEDGGYGGGALTGARVGVFAGASPSQTFKEAVSRSFAERAEQVYVLNVPSTMASRLGYLRNWSGPAELVDTACSSSLKAVRDACQALARGECQLAVAGGARVLLTPLRGGKAFTIETSSGHTRTFDAAADGVGAGEGSVVLLLKPLKRAVADGDAIRAVIRGGAINQDGRSASIAAPNPAAQARVIGAAARESGVELTSLDFFEAHGTGTALGDPIEIDGLTRAFAEQAAPAASPGHKVAISSVKGNFGHLDAAAGAIGLAKAILALEHGMVPRQPHFTTANPRIDFAKAPVFVARENHPLAPERQPWRCGVSAFGLSGINVHLILEQAPARGYGHDDGSWLLAPISAASADGLRLYADLLLEALAASPHWPLAAVAATLTRGRDHLPWRLGIAARSCRELLDALLAWRLAQPAALLQAAAASGREIAVTGLADAAAAALAGEAFVAGDTPVWPEGMAVSRVHLPPVPMERSCCWPRFVAPAAVAGQGLLAPGVHTPVGWSFPVPVALESFWPVAEHRLGGRPALVGMAMVPLLAEAVTAIEPLSALRIAGLCWLRPLLREEVRSVTLGLTPCGDGWQARLMGQGHDGEWRDYAEASLSRLAVADERLELNSLRAAMGAGEEVVAAAGESPVQVSGRWACRQRWWRDPDGSRLLALLQLPEEYVADLRQTPWHPALLDVAASLALDRPGLVPASCREILLYHPLSARVHALVSHVPGNPRQASAPVVVDCLLLDGQGRVLVALNGLTFLPYVQPRARLHPLAWQALAPLTEQGWVAGGVLLLGAGAVADDLGRLLAGQGRAWQQAALPVSEAQAQGLAAGLAAGAWATICWLLPEDGVAADGWPLAGFIQALLARGLKQPLRLFVVGQGAVTMDDTPRHAPASPDAGLALGLLLAVNQEEPLFCGCYLERAAAAPPAALVAELLNPAPLTGGPLLLDRDGGRWTRALAPALTAGDSAPFSLPPGTAVVVSGGLGAMALTLAQPLCANSGCAVALLHRGPFPPESRWPALLAEGEPLTQWRIRQLQGLRAAGVRFRLYSCDVGERQQLRHTLSRVRDELGPISGVVHTAGVAGDGFLIRKTRETFARVLAPKVHGARHLHYLTLKDRPHIFVVAGSRTGLTGAPGQSDYAAANAWLAAFAWWRRRQGLPALVLDWNTWAGIGMAARAGADTAAGWPLPPEQAGLLLTQALVSGVTQLVVTMPGEPLPGQGAEPAAVVTAPASDAALPLGQRLMALWAQGLGYDRPLSLEDDFYALGGDSITGLHLINRINRELGQALSLADLFSHSRLGRFIELVAGGTGQTPEHFPVAAAPPRADYPVSWQQLAVLQAAASTAPHTGYNLPQFLRLPAGVDQGRLQEVWRELIARHEILRTRFLALDTPAPRMAIMERLPFLLEKTWVAGFDPSTCQALITPFALGQGPLFRVQLLENAAGEQLLFFDIHHAVADARTIDLLLAEMAALYLGHPLPAPGLQQKDAAWHQQQGVEGDQQARAYWLGRFGDDLPLLDLAADWPRPPRHSHRGATFTFALPRAVVPALRAVARGQATTTFNIILTLWGVLLSRHADQEEVVLAVAADGRERAEFEGSCGMFVSLLPLRLHLSPEESFSTLLRRNHLLHADALRHRSFALNRLLGELKPPVMPERTPLAEVTFSYMNFDSAASPDPAFPLARLEVANPAAKADLAIFTSDSNERISCALEYYADLFSPARMERLGQHFLALVDQLVAKGPDLPLHAYSLLTAAEEALSAPSGPELPMGGDTLCTAIGRWLEEAPDSPAVRCQAYTFSRAQLLAGARRVAAGLRALGIGPGDRVGLTASIDARLPALMLGVVLCGASCCPAFAEPVRPAGDGDGGLLRALISDVATPPGAGGVPIVDLEALWQGDGDPEARGTALPAPGDIAFYAIDSPGGGSALSHEAIVAFAAQARGLGLATGQRVVVAARPDTVLGLQGLWAVLLAGGSLYLGGQQALDLDGLPGLLRSAEAQVVIMARGLAEQLAAWQPGAIRGVRRLITVAEWPLAERAARALTSCAPQLTLMGGLTMPGSGLLLALGQPDSQPSPYPRAGRPAAHVRLTIVDRSGRPTPPGAWGTIRVAGQAAAIHERLVGHGRLAIRGRWREGGELELLARGEAHSAEGVRIRAALLALPGVREAALLPGEGGGWRAVVAAEPGFVPEQARAALRRSLPVGLMEVPLVVRQRLPLTPEGRVDLAVIRAMAPPSAAGPSPPLPERAAMEGVILEIFREMFPGQAVSREESFFDLGGHSLLGLQIVNRLARHGRWQLTIRDLFDAPTPAELAARLLQAERGAEAIPVLPGPAGGRFPLSHAQQRLYCLHQMDGGAVGYNMPFAFALQGGFDVDRFRRALARLCERHEVLRTTFVEEEGQLWQVIIPEVALPIVVDHLPAGGQEQALHRFRGDAATPFDLAQPPLFRLRLCYLGGEEAWLSLVMHHIIGDGWSMQILFGELLEFYAAEVQGVAAQLPPLAVQYKDYAVWQQQRDWQAMAAFWRETLAGAPTRIDFPRERPLPPVRGYPAGSCARRLDDAVLAGLRGHAAGHGVSLATLVLTLFAALLHRLTQQTDMVIGVGVAGRERQELEGLIGFFVNILPIRVRLDAESELPDLLQSVHAAMLAALERQEYPFDLLVREVAPARGANREALLNVMFEYQRFSDLSRINRARQGEEALVGTVIDQARLQAPAAESGQTAKYDLTLFVQDAPDGCTLRAEFDSELLRATTVAAWLEYLEGFMRMTLKQE